MQRLVKMLLITMGSLSLGLGVLGIVLPLLPTTPLLLLAAACYVRSSKRLYHWLMNHKWFGAYIQNFRSGKGIPLKAKVIGIVIVWFSFGFSAIFIVNILLLKMFFIFGACFFTVLMLRMKTLRQ